MELLGAFILLQGGLDIRKDGVRLDPGIEVLLEKYAESVAILRAEKIKTEISRSDVVGFLDNQVASPFKPLRCPEKGESDEQTEKGQNGGINDADKLLDGAAPDLLMPAADPVAELHGKQQGDGHAQKNGEREKGGGVRIEEGDGEHGSGD
ncbi:MAG: hypothetical protein EBS49_05285 [Verrucomicrobia bacterium]|nr:hypothetical protein [Verrucomicrobiota bacterium]